MQRQFKEFFFVANELIFYMKSTAATTTRIREKKQITKLKTDIRQDGSKCAKSSFWQNFILLKLFFLFSK